MEKKLVGISLDVLYEKNGSKYDETNWIQKSTNRIS